MQNDFWYDQYKSPNNHIYDTVIDGTLKLESSFDQPVIASKSHFLDLEPQAYAKNAAEIYDKNGKRIQPD